MSRRRLPFKLPPARAYSSTPTAVRSRRWREREKQRALECAAGRSDNTPPTTSWFCACGWKWTGLGTLSATVQAFELHVKDCLFGEPVQVIVRRRVRVSP
jgi:hypothetical protein